MKSILRSTRCDARLKRSAPRLELDYALGNADSDGGNAVTIESNSRRSFAPGWLARMWLPNPAMTEDEAAIQVLRAGASIGVLFLLVYLAADLDRRGGVTSGIALMHWAGVLAAVVFLAATWSSGFRRLWKLWNLLICIVLIAFFIGISALTHEADSRFVAVLLIPVASAAFVNWGWRWQTLLGLACIALYALGEVLVPIAGDGSFYRWTGLFAAVVIAEFIALFTAMYRSQLRAQVEQLTAAAEFRDSQVAAMAHDVRSPVAALAGFVDLLEDEELSATDRAEVLGRIGSTAWSMELAVNNVLDLYQIQGGHLARAPMRLDPNRIVADAAGNCATQAVRKGLKLTVNYGDVGKGSFDPRHLDRMVRNLLAYSINRLKSGEVRLATSPGPGTMTIEVSDDGPALAAEEIARLSARADTNGGRPASLGLYVARALAEAGGGTMQIASGASGGLTLRVEMPCGEGEAEPRAT
jgi:signal transduction histidine kinase